MKRNGNREEEENEKDENNDRRSDLERNTILCNSTDSGESVSAAV